MNIHCPKPLDMRYSINRAALKIVAARLAARGAFKIVAASIDAKS